MRSFGFALAFAELWVLHCLGLTLLQGSPPALAAKSLANYSHTQRDVLRHFEKTFDHNLYKKYQAMANGTAPGAPMTSETYLRYSSGSLRPHCDPAGSAPEVKATERARSGAFPGGITKRHIPDFSKMITDIASKSPSGGGSTVLPMAMGAQGLQLGMGLVQTVAAAVVHIVPPLIPPPVWINMPLPCAPMLTGHNCFGAVLYPITLADFLVADMTDKVMDGIIAGFPDTYATKVGKTSDEMYKACGSSFLTMHCSAIFPRCTMPMSRDEAIPVGGRVPLCLHLCILPLIMCPGFWVGDVIGSCEFISVPPMCTQGFFWNLFRLPPQYVDYDEANPYPGDCPEDDTSGASAREDAAVYDAPAQTPSVIEAEAALSAGAKLPRVEVY